MGADPLHLLHHGKHFQQSAMRRVTGIPDLVLLQERGVKIVCPSVNWMEKPRKIDQLLKCSVESVLRHLNKGIFAVGEEEAAPEGSVLELAKARIRESGMSHEEIATRVGVSRQAVQQFMAANSVQTRILDKYLNALEAK